jgi:mono/diheme cytochrome c family protein
MRNWATLGLLTCLAIAVAGWSLSAPRPVVAAISPALEQDGDAERGKLFFNAGGCASCHATPGQEDRLKLGGGLELKSPFGTFIAPNISPHKSDGIGAWKVADLVNAMQAGVSPSGEHYYPAFPYTTYANARVEDLRDLMAFLRTLPPVAGKAPAHRIAFPFNIRRGLGLWKVASLDPRPLTPDPQQSAEWNRGRYLTEAFGHCAECHSARDFKGAILADFRYAGGPDMEGAGWVPNISQHRDGVADWSTKDIAWMLKSGDTPDGDVVGGSMKSVVKNMAQLPDADRNAIAAYIKTLPARPSPPKPSKNPT